jgi:type II secretory ATPase GspE/PulE/Tfp pilus assembly ATPase PilB-like protein
MAKGGELTNEELKNILLQGNYVAKADMVAAEEYVEKNGGDLIRYFLAKQIITKDLLGQAIAEFFKVSYGNLMANRPTKELTLTIPKEFALKYRLVLFKFDKSKKAAIVATDNPNKTKLSGALDSLARYLAVPKLTMVYALPEDLDEVMLYYRDPLSARLEAIVTAGERVAPLLFDEIVEEATIFRASDLHFEPKEDGVLVRFRIDGVMTEQCRFSREIYSNIVNRIKVRANLRLDDHFSAQDGAIRHQLADGAHADMRISVVPTLDGEKIVIRLLSEYVRDFTMADVGLSERDQHILQENADRPFGMILVIGPTGSGKTTTLYALLKNVATPDINVTTIEDPVEYKISNINQIQVNEATNLTFAAGLRSIVRQDPDVILVGEIRDIETAEISVNAALTGHLLFSTFHANDSATAIPRLLEMGVEPFLLASTLNLVIAQRLARRLCNKCRYSYVVKKAELKKSFPLAEKYFKGKDSITLYKGKGCNACNHSGYTGRIALFEFLQVSREMQDLILKRPSTQEIWDLAARQGAMSMFADGVEKSKAGVTTLDEVMRVANIN